MNPLMNLPLEERLAAIQAQQQAEMEENRQRDHEALARIDEMEASIAARKDDNADFERGFAQRYRVSPVGQVETAVRRALRA